MTPTITRIGMPAVSRQPMTRDRLIRFAESGAPLYASLGAPCAAALCADYLRLVAENAQLQRQLAWQDEPTRRQDQPSQAELTARCTRTGVISIPGGTP